jgi:hypothetical protein
MGHFDIQLKRNKKNHKTIQGHAKKIAFRTQNSTKLEETTSM